MGRLRRPGGLPRAGDSRGLEAEGVPPDLDSWNAASGINAALTEFGQIVADALEDDYIDWDGEYEAPDFET